MSGQGQVRSRVMSTARVLTNKQICPDHYRLRLGLSGFPPSRPGQFVNLRCCDPGGDDEPRVIDLPPGRLPAPSGGELAGRQALLRRPFSIAGRRDADDGAVELDIIHRVVGVGTAWLAGLAPGAEVNLIGPLGNGFAPVEGRPAAVVLGGGVGIPPMLYLAETLTAAGVEVVAIVGARTARALPLTVSPAEPPSQAGWPSMCTTEFAARGVPAIVATEDGSLGVTGLGHQALLGWLEGGAPAEEDLAAYACGPEPMMRAVSDICIGRGIPCQLALERHMACGMGTCQGCICKTRADGGRTWRYRLVCTDGPVFDARQLVWD